MENHFVPIHVAAICGSLNPNSKTRLSLQIALRGAQEKGATIQLIDLRDYQLVFCGVGAENLTPDVYRLRKDIERAQGIILGTPEYHSGPSGVLKNALDLMGFKEFQGKIVGLVGVAGGSTGAINSLNSLRTIVRSLRAWVIPDQVSVPHASSKFDETGRINDPDLQQRLLEVGRKVARFTYLHTSEQAQEFLKNWEEARENPGGE